ncbi:MAG: hypothetical protein VKO64_01650 [Candidatus Sericytochromatia bacterium]|nr:hypothetical protein [Candidatus Sericytochromatia bacterium]
MRAPLQAMLIASLGFTSIQWTFEGWATARVRLPGLQSVPPPRVAKAIAAGFDGFLADLAYIRFSTYWGYWLTHGRAFHNVAPLLDLVVTLDPRLRSAYEIGSVALGDAGDVDGAIRLLAKGAKASPTDSWYPFQTGMMLFLYSTRYAEAATAFERAASMPGADPAAAFFAARMHLSSARKDMALRIWYDIWRTTKSPSMRTCAANWIKKEGRGDLLKDAKTGE